MAGGKKSSLRLQTEKRYWSNQRFYGVIGNAVAATMRKIRLMREKAD